MKQIHELQETIHYHFKTPLYLEIALTHSSYANEVKHQVKYNERQEFLGDAVLSIIVSDYLFNNYTVPEGELTKLRAAIVCEKSLDVMANKIGLGQYLRLGRGEEMTGGRTRPSIIADAFEALIAAIYLDSGIESARSFVLPFVIEMLEHEDSLSFKDYKTIPQEIIQQNAPVNFVGNVEARSLPMGECDVAVCDGFTGNVVLKLIEGMAKFFSNQLKGMLLRSTKTKIAALLLKDSVADFKKKLDYKEHGGAPLLGISKTVIKAHGSSDARAIKNAIRQAKQCIESGVIEQIEQNLSQMKAQAKAAEEQ